MLEFKEDAICLSGLSGTKLKCDIIGAYYKFWWSITSGGKSQNYRYPTGIIDLNAGTGEVYIKDTDQIVLGSAGHVLDLKANTPEAKNLSVILVEENKDCYERLKKVIRRRWPKFTFVNENDLYTETDSNIILVNLKLHDAINIIKNINLGNSIYFFDPLRSVEWNSIESVARARISSFYQTGTEFIIFLFTSDWFLGRDDFESLPITSSENRWNAGEKQTVEECDRLFGNVEWRATILTNESIEDKERKFIELYRKRLHKWFRYVLPLPFCPKLNQIFHLIICSNFETGIRMTRDEYTKITGNPKYSPNNSRAYENFKKLHPEITCNFKGNKRPNEWKILWSVITEHEEGICDEKCKSFSKYNSTVVKKCLNWLQNKGYIREIHFEEAWANSPRMFQLDWNLINKKLGISPPPQLQPITPDNARLRYLFNATDEQL